MAGVMEYKVDFKVTSWHHDDPAIQKYLDENLEKLINVWWENIGFYGLENYVNRIIKSRQRGGTKNA